MGTEAVHTGTFLRGPYSIDRLHQRLNQGSPGLNIDALLSPRDDVRLGGSPHRGPPVSLSGHRDPAPLASPPLCRSNSALPLPTTTGHGAGPSLINTSPMCMQSALSDLFNPDSVKRSRLEEVEAFMTGGKRARPEDMHDEHVPNPAAAAAAVEPDRVPPSDLRRVGRVPQSELNLKLTPAIDAAKRRSMFAGDLGTFDPSLSSLGGLFPASLRPGSARADDGRLAEIAQHLTAAFDRLTQPEQQRVCGLFNQPSIGSCLDTLLSVVSSASDASDAAPFAPPPQASGMDAAAMFPTTAPLRMESFAAQGPSDTFTNPLHTLGSSRLSPRVTLGSTKLTPREVESMPMQAPVPPRPPHNREYGSALLDQLQEQQRATKRRAAAYADEPAARFPSPRRRKTGPPSSRDKVWDLLTAYEKKQILADHMSAAEGTKALLERRAEQLGCEVVDMTDDDDWDIGFRLTECRATSEPLPKPKNCSICLRHGVVLHRHSYYCRRCAQLYRAIHRKKTTLQNEGQDGSQ